MILGLPRPSILAISASGPASNKLHHVGLPLSKEEHCNCALQCQLAGASLYHLTVHDEAGKPSLEPSMVTDMVLAIDAACQSRMPIQLNLSLPLDASPTELWEQQRAVVQTGGIKAISIAFRDLFPQGAEEERELQARDFLDECQTMGVAVQFVFNHVADLDWFYAYRQYGLLTIEKPKLLFDLTALMPKPEPNAHALRPFLAKLDELNLRGKVHWSACAPDCAELPVAVAVLSLGGHCQIGFAHNIHTVDGEVAPDNASQLIPIRTIADMLGRPAANAVETLALLRG